MSTFKKPLNIFYEEPDPDRWFKFDRYLRKIIRRIYRGEPRPGGQTLVFQNLIKGLDKLKYPYRINDYKYAIKHPEEVACIIGKDLVLDKINWKNPIAFGAAFGINPVSHPNILSDYPIKKLLVPGEWVKQLFLPYGSDNVTVWPVGIDTENWHPASTPKKTDFLIYNKIRWDNAETERDLIEPIKKYLQENNYTFFELKYGHYESEDLKAQLAVCKYALFLCEHETQGIAYQQILASGVPILAWDRGGYWRDPSWFPDKIQFKPVTSVPYWSEQCGVKFTSINDFKTAFNSFMQLNETQFFKPREYILENLTLEKCALKYVEIISSISA